MFIQSTSVPCNDTLNLNKILHYIRALNSCQECGALKHYKSSPCVSIKRKIKKLEEEIGQSN